MTFNAKGEEKNWPRIHTIRSCFARVFNSAMEARHKSSENCSKRTTKVVAGIEQKIVVDLEHFRIECKQLDFISLHPYMLIFPTIAAKKLRFLIILSCIDKNRLNNQHDIRFTFLDEVARVRSIRDKRELLKRSTGIDT